VTLRLSNDLTVKSVDTRVDANGNGKFGHSEKGSQKVRNEVETLISGIDKNYESKVKGSSEKQKPSGVSNSKTGDGKDGSGKP